MINDPNYIPYGKSVGEPKRGNFAYGPENANPAKPTPLDAKKDISAVGVAHFGGDYAMGGIQKTASVTGPTGVVETTASQENLSAKYKYPQKSQDTVPQDLVAKPGSQI